MQPANLTLPDKDVVVDIACDVLADPEWTARVVIAAIVAQTQLSRRQAAWRTLGGALDTPKGGEKQ